MNLWYMASPYSRYPHGLEAAYILACEEHARLIRAGVPTFCPISHTHGAAMYGRISPTDHETWMAADRPFMRVCTGLIVLEAEGWRLSRGMAEEIDTFHRAGKPVVRMTPGIVPAELFEAVAA